VSSTSSFLLISFNRRWIFKDLLLPPPLFTPPSVGTAYLPVGRGSTGRPPLLLEGLCRNMKKTDIFQRGKGGRVEKI